MRTPHVQSRTRESGYDLLRLLAMVAVVATHVLMVYRVPGAPASAVSVLDALLHFAVPVFFFVSGALVWGRYSGTGRVEYASFLRRRALTVAAPYLAWSALYLTVAGIRGNWIYWLTHTPLLVLTGRSWYHLYFVPVLLLFYLLTPVAAPLVRRWPELWVAATFIAGLTLLEPAVALADRVGGPMLVTFTVVALTHLTHVTLGGWFAQRRNAILPFLRRWWPALLVPGVLLLTGNALGTFDQVFTRVAVRAVTTGGMALVILGLVGIVFSVRTESLEPRRVAKLAAFSFGVYLVHPALVLAWRSAITAVGGSSWWDSGWFAVLSVSIITAASLAISAALAGHTRTAWLVGHAPVPRPDAPTTDVATTLALSET